MTEPGTTTMTLGARLRARREAREMSLQDLSARTRVPLGKLLALEQGRWEELPAPVYARGFIRSAAAALGAPPDEVELLVDLYRHHTPDAAVEVPSLTKSDLLIPILVRGEEQERSRAVLGIALLVLTGLAIPIVAYLIS